MLKTIIQWISWASLVVLMTMPVLFLFDRMTLDAIKWGMLIATAVWFVTASAWMWNDSK